VRDVERNVDVRDFKIVVERTWEGWSVVQHAYFSEFVDSVRTDADGRYSVTFMGIPGENYAVGVDDWTPYQIEYLPHIPFVVGGENVLDMNAWLPVVIKLNLDVRNNNHPNLKIFSEVIATHRYMGSASVFDQNINTVVYVGAKPNSEMELEFGYWTGNSNADFHSRREVVHTTLQDTISFNYVVDCSGF
jgi:hypothetical protein